jgi:hypothetical protein
MLMAHQKIKSKQYLDENSSLKDFCEKLVESTWKRHVTNYKNLLSTGCDVFHDSGRRPRKFDIETMINMKWLL